MSKPSTFWRSVSTGEPNTAQLMREIVLDPIPRASERATEHGSADKLPPGFDAWFARAVAREPAERFQNAAELWKVMQTLFREDDAPSTKSFRGYAELQPATSAKPINKRQCVMASPRWPPIDTREASSAEYTPHHHGTGPSLSKKPAVGPSSPSNASCTLDRAPTSTGCGPRWPFRSVAV